MLISDSVISYLHPCLELDGSSGILLLRTLPLNISGSMTGMSSQSSSSSLLQSPSKKLFTTAARTEISASSSVTDDDLAKFPNPKSSLNDLDFGSVVGLLYCV